jgi:hypothetical protein
MERVVDAYRRQRLADDRKDAKRARFGRIYPIGREDYTKEVTEASIVDEDDDEDEKGTGVVCFLYKNGLVQLSFRCGLLLRAHATLEESSVLFFQT